MVYKALEKAKEYADSVIVSIDSIKFKGTITARPTHPGAYTP